MVFPHVQEKKKIQSPVVVEQGSPFGPRPSTSSRRVSERSVNGGFGNVSPINRRLSLGIQQPGLGTSFIISPSHGISDIKEGKRVRVPRNSAQTSLASHLREETVSVVSSFSGPISP